VDATFEVNVADHPIVTEFLKQFLNPRRRMCRFDGLVVEGPVVNAHAQFTVFLHRNNTRVSQGLREGRMQPWLMSSVS
jgi:hypothetical protein